MPTSSKQFSESDQSRHDELVDRRKFATALYASKSPMVTQIAVPFDDLAYEDRSRPGLRHSHPTPGHHQGHRTR